MSLDRVTITHLSDDGLRQAQWQFYRYGTELLVDVYEELVRLSLRHKFKSVRKWARLGNPRESSIRKDDVPLTADIKAEAVEAYVAQMKSKLTVTFQS